MTDRSRTTVPSLITPGIIARELGIPLHRAQHVLATRSHINPVARAGIIRLFDRRAMAMVRHEINAIDACKTGRKSHGN